MPIVIKDGAVKGLRTALMLLKIMIPIYLLVVLLHHTEFFNFLGGIVAPAMRLFALPGDAVVPLVVGVFSDEYSVVAAMGGFDFTKAHITIIAMITLCFHSIPVETVVTRKIGMPALRIAIFRIGLAIGTGALCAWLAMVFLGGERQGSGFRVQGSGNVGREGTAHLFDAGAGEIATEMGLGTLGVVLNLLRVILPLMIVIELMLVYKVTDALARKLTPFCRLLGIGKAALLPLLVGLLLGVTYGAGALAEMNRTNPLPKRDMASLGVFLFSCHGIIETTYLFAVAGGSAVFVSALRLGIAVVVTAVASRIFSLRKA